MILNVVYIGDADGLEQQFVHAALQASIATQSDCVLASRQNDPTDDLNSRWCMHARNQYNYSIIAII